MRTLVSPHAIIPAAEVAGPAVPIELLDEGRARLFRVDIHSTDLVKTSEWPDDKILAALAVNLMHAAWLEPRLLCDDYRKDTKITNIGDLKIHANGSYDGVAIGINDMNLPLFKTSPLFHVLSTERKDLVCKLAVVGPAIFHPTRVSSNTPITTPKPIQKRGKLSAIFYSV